MDKDLLDKLDKRYRHLEAGERYRVARPFLDYDGCHYPAGDVVEFIGASFLPYDDGLSLFVIHRGREEQIRLQLRPEEQQDMVEGLQCYLVREGARGQ